MRRNELGKALKKFQAIDKVRRPSLPVQALPRLTKTRSHSTSLTG